MGGSGPRRLAIPGASALNFLSPPQRADWDSASGFGEPAAATAGGREGSTDHANDGRVFSLLSSYSSPPPDSGAFVFQVGSHSHLQVSDKPARTSPTHPGPSQTGEGAEESCLDSA